MIRFRAEDNGTTYVTAVDYSPREPGAQPEVLRVTLAEVREWLEDERRLHVGPRRALHIELLLAGLAALEKAATP